MITVTNLDICMEGAYTLYLGMWVVYTVGVAVHQLGDAMDDTMARKYKLPTCWITRGSLYQGSPTT